MLRIFGAIIGAALLAIGMYAALNRSTRALFGVNAYWDKPITVTMPDVTYAHLVFTPNSDKWNRCFENGASVDWGRSATSCIVIHSSDTQLINLLKACQGPHSKPSRSETKGYVFYITATHIIDPGDKPRSEHYYVYFPESGEIGSGHDWLFVPPNLKARLQSEINKKRLPIQP